MDVKGCLKMAVIKGKRKNIYLYISKQLGSMCKFVKFINVSNSNVIYLTNTNYYEIDKNSN